MGVSSAEKGLTFAPSGEVDRLNAGMSVMSTATAIERGDEQPVYFSLPDDLQSITGTPTIPVIEVRIGGSQQEKLRKVIEESDSIASSGDITLLRGRAGHINLIAVGYNGQVAEGARTFVPYSPSSPGSAIEGAPTSVERISTVLMDLSRK